LAKDTLSVWDRYEDRLTVPHYEIKLYKPSTLTGRPFAILNDFKQALNFQDQGSGADMLARAIAWLPTEVAAMLLVPVHDELVFEVPVNNIENVKRLVKETMVRAGDEVLGGGIPVEVETVVGEGWRKAHSSVSVSGPGEVWRKA
jgi:DNA polymerase-1